MCRALKETCISTPICTSSRSIICDTEMASGAVFRSQTLERRLLLSPKGKGAERDGGRERAASE